MSWLDAIAAMQQAHLDLADAVDELRKRMADMQQPGTVAAVDAAQQLVQLDLGPDPETGATKLSPWAPYAQWAGDMKDHSAPSVGQQMMLHAPGGDLEQAYAVPFTFSNANPSPSQSADERVRTWGGTKRTWTKDAVKTESGTASHEVSKDAVASTKGGASHVVSADSVLTKKGNSAVAVTDKLIDQKAPKIRMNC